MRVLIVACGHTGVTLKVANKMAKMLSGVAVDVIDGKSKQDVSGYDVYVLGSNVHFGKLNKNFVKRLSEVTFVAPKAELYGYICGAEIEKSDLMIKKMSELASFALVRHVWGELNSSGTRFFRKFAIESFKKGRKDDGLPEPRILDKELKAIARAILEQKSIGKQDA